MAFSPVRPPGLGDYLDRPSHRVLPRTLRACLHIAGVSLGRDNKTPAPPAQGGCPPCPLAQPPMDKSREAGRRAAVTFPHQRRPQVGAQPRGRRVSLAPHTPVSLTQSWGSPILWSAHRLLKGGDEGVAACLPQSPHWVFFKLC